jgi:hypothetical protein
VSDLDKSDRLLGRNPGRWRSESLRLRLLPALPKDVELVLLLGREHWIERLQSFIKQSNVFDLLVALDRPDSRYHIVKGRSCLGLLSGIQSQAICQIANGVILPLARCVGSRYA